MFLSHAAGKVNTRESTLGSRPNHQKQFQTPAPGEYNIDRIDKLRCKSGGYTFGHPFIHFRFSRTPGRKIEI